MTDRQHKHLYLRAWSAAWKRNWRQQRGQAVRVHDHPEPMVERVEQVARERAAQRNCRVDAELLRHSCHLVAIGRDKSSLLMNNRELDQVLAVFRLLADPDNLHAQVVIDHPDVEARRRLEWSVEHCGLTEAYVIHVCHGKFGTKEWKSLADDQLRQLVITLHARAKSHEAQTHKPEPVAADNCPF